VKQYFYEADCWLIPLIPPSTVIWHTAWLLDQSGRGTHESSMAKVICSEAIWRVVDRSIAGGRNELSKTTNEMHHRGTEDTEGSLSILPSAGWAGAFPAERGDR